MQTEFKKQNEQLKHFQKKSIKNVWLDCDPGLDDTIALILAATDPFIKLIGVSTSPGNTNLDNTTINALSVLHGCHRQDVFVVKGSNQLIQGNLQFAQHMHGSDGLGGVDIPKSTVKPITENNFETIYSMIMKEQQSVIWANTGSMTNIYLLLKKYPDIKSKICKIVAMGGARGQGNITPAAQFNIFFDPHAAKGVFQIKGDLPLVLIPLQLTHQVCSNEKVMKQLMQINNPFTKAIHNMLQQYKKMYFQAYGMNYPPVHDPCVIYYILFPQQFGMKKAWIDIDTCEVSYGRTNIHFFNPKNPKAQFHSNSEITMSIQSVDKFWDHFLNSCKRIFKS